MKLKVKVKTQMDSAKQILLKRSLNKGGTIQQFFTHEVRQKADPYVPKLSGTLKNTAQEKVSKIWYIQPYSKKQWFKNKGKGLRGRQWVNRMWADRGDEIVRAVAKEAGVKTK